VVKWAHDGGYGNGKWYYDAMQRDSVLLRRAGTIVTIDDPKRIKEFKAWRQGYMATRAAAQSARGIVCSMYGVRKMRGIHLLLSLGGVVCVALYCRGERNHCTVREVL